MNAKRPSSTTDPTTRSRVLAAVISAAVALVALALVLGLTPRTTTLPIGPAPVPTGATVHYGTLNPIVHASPYIVVDPPADVVGVERESEWSDSDTRFLQEVENTTTDVRVGAATDGAWSLVEAGEGVCDSLANGMSPADAAASMLVPAWPGDDQLAITAAAQTDLCGQGGA